MPFYTSEQILNQALDEATGTLKTSGGSGAASATAANQTTTNDRLGTPGTGEPAHAGGSTGVIGWLRDILAKIAAFGTSAVPSADVVSVQYPNAYIGKATLGALDEALTVDTLGASQIAFNFPQGNGAGAVVFEGANTNATSPTWVLLRTLRPLGNFGLTMRGNGQASVDAGDQVLVECAGFNQARIRISAYTSGSFEAIAQRIYSPGLVPVCAEISTTYYTTASSTANPLGTFLSTGIYYTDTTTPLAANAAFVGSTRTMAQGNNFFNIQIQASGGSSAANGSRIQKSSDATDWFHCIDGSLVDSNPMNSSARRTTTYYRVLYSNGVSPQGTFSVTSSQTPN